MLNPANLSPQAQQLLSAQGARPGMPIQAPELSRLLQKGIDADHDQQLSETEAQTVGFTPQDRNLINQELRSAPPSAHLSLQDAMMVVSFPDKAASSPPTPGAPKTIFSPPVVSAGQSTPAPPPKHTLGDDSLYLDTQPVLKPNPDPNRPELQTLEAVSFRSQGKIGPVSLGTQLQVDSTGNPQGSATTLDVTAGPALSLGARLDTQPLMQGLMPNQIDLTGKGSVGRINYGTQLTYTGEGVSSTRANLGVQIAAPLSIGIESGQQRGPEGMAVRDIGLNTGHQFGALSLSSKVSLDTTTGRTTAGGGLGWQIAPGASLNLNGESDGQLGKVGLGFSGTF